MATFWEEQAAAAKAQLVLVQSAIATVLTGGTSYSLDTGQTRLMVTRTTLSELRLLEKELLSRILSFEPRCGASVYVRPGF